MECVHCGKTVTPQHLAGRAQGWASGALVPVHIHGSRATQGPWVNFPEPQFSRLLKIAACSLAALNGGDENTIRWCECLWKLKYYFNISYHNGYFLFVCFDDCRLQMISFPVPPAQHTSISSSPWIKSSFQKSFWYQSFLRNIILSPYPSFCGPNHSPPCQESALSEIHAWSCSHTHPPSSSNCPWVDFVQSGKI